MITLTDYEKQIVELIQKNTPNIYSWIFELGVTKGAYDVRIEQVSDKIDARDTPVSDEYKKGYDKGYELGFNNGYCAGESGDDRHFRDDYDDTENDQYSEFENHCTECGLHNDKCEC